MRLQILLGLLLIPAVAVGQRVLDRTITTGQLGPSALMTGETIEAPDSIIALIVMDQESNAGIGMQCAKDAETGGVFWKVLLFEPTKYVSLFPNRDADRVYFGIRLDGETLSYASAGVGSVALTNNKTNYVYDHALIATQRIVARLSPPHDSTAVYYTPRDLFRSLGVGKAIRFIFKRASGETDYVVWTNRAPGLPAMLTKTEQTCAGFFRGRRQ